MDRKNISFKKSYLPLGCPILFITKRSDRGYDDQESDDGYLSRSSEENKLMERCWLKIVGFVDIFTGASFVGSSARLRRDSARVILT